jgi:general secretion pathway protein E/type IV pilus assembly protein PilB
MSLEDPTKRAIGQVLVAQGVITDDQLKIALLEQTKTGQPVGKLLVMLGFVSEAILRDALGVSMGKKSIDLSRAIIDPAALKLVPQDIAKRFRLLPLDYNTSTNTLTIAIADPNDIVALDRLRQLTQQKFTIETLVGGDSELSAAIDRYYGHELSIDGILHEIETGEVDYKSMETLSAEYSQPVVRLIDALLTDAVKREASDIHFEPEANFLRIRYRIDGMLRQIQSLHKSYWSAMAVRIKVISGMNIAETRAPQDGRVSLNVSGRPVDFRAAVQPTIHGENIVLRILDRQKGIVPLDKLGLDDVKLSTLKLMIARPEGIILVTGPTGSGKTTTLYSILNHINAEEVNIMTLEDPVEYPMAQIRQTSLADASKLDFATGIRSMMRQDPDIILVGEIRDPDTAEMAFRAAMTGHQVYSTLHTNSAIGIIPRLLDIGILPDIMSGNIIGVVSQRLIRQLCPQCKEAYIATGSECRLLGITASVGTTIYKAVGCDKCDMQGYKGRMAIMELLRMDKDIDELIVKRSTAREIFTIAASKGFTTLADDGIVRVLNGTTSLEEVGRVTDLTERM